ncbi:hypothetical protein AALB39_03230 [Lachnospiraceae bacterium 54-53]
MKPVNIIMEPGELLDIKECSIDKRVNEHFTAVVTGCLHQAADERSLRNFKKSPLILKAFTKEREEILIFRGQVREWKLSDEGELRKINIFAVSDTIELDKRKHIRTFQGADQTYSQIIESLLRHHEPASVICEKGNGAVTRGFVLQYMETDWQLLKRLASQLNTVLVVECAHNHASFYFGTPEKKGKASLDLSHYGIRCYKDCDVGETVEYLVKSREVLDLCEYVRIGDCKYYVYAMNGNIHEGEMEFDYVLRPISGFKVPSCFRQAIAGVSIMGNVLDVNKNSVQISLSSEEDKNFNKPMWFPFSTVYSSPDGTGWYCMPGKGDSIRLYLPDPEEHHGYVISYPGIERKRGVYFLDRPGLVPAGEGKMEREKEK